MDNYNPPVKHPQDRNSKNHIYADKIRRKKKKEYIN